MLEDGRGRRAGKRSGCSHFATTLIPSELGYHARCRHCESLGPGRPNPEAARKALLVLGAREPRPYRAARPGYERAGF